MEIKAPQGRETLPRLESVVVAVADLEQATDVYARLFGVDAEAEVAAGEIRRRRFTLENCALDLVSPSRESGDSWLAFWLEKRGDSPVGLVFHCPEVEASEARLQERGVSVLDDVEPLGAALEPAATRGVPAWLSERPQTCAQVDRERSTVYGLDHAVVRTQNGDASRAVYEEGLGIRVALDRTFEEWNLRLIFCRIGEVTLELASSTEHDVARASRPEADARPTFDRPDRDQLWGFTWFVDDADAARERLAGLGIQASEVRLGRRPGTRVFTVRGGCCGVPTLMLERLPAG